MDSGEDCFRDGCCLSYTDAKRAGKAGLQHALTAHWRGKQVSDLLHQRVQRDAKTHGLMRQLTWATDVGAMCWPLPCLFLSLGGNAAGTSLHHEVPYLQICVSPSSLPSAPCRCQAQRVLLWSLRVLPPTTHTLIDTTRHNTLHFFSVLGCKNNCSVWKFLLIWEREGGTQTLLN